MKGLAICLIHLIFTVQAFAGPAGQIAQRYCQQHNCDRTGGNNLLAAMIADPPQGTCFTISVNSAAYIEKIQIARIESNRSWWLLLDANNNVNEVKTALSAAESFAAKTKTSSRLILLAEPYDDLEVAKHDYCTADFDLWKSSIYSKNILGILIPKDN